MKETAGWVKIKKYTDGGQPVCGRCGILPAHRCMRNKWEVLACRWIPGPECLIWHGESKSDRLLDACKAAYRKHHLNDDSIGWAELDTILLDALCNSMGEGAFNTWLLAQEK